MNHKNPASRLARWIIRLEEYTFKIEYKKGKANGAADVLSRWPLPDPNDEETNKDIVICVILIKRIRLSDRMITFRPELNQIKNTMIREKTMLSIKNQLNADSLFVIRNDFKMKLNQNDHEYVVNVILISKWNNEIEDDQSIVTHEKLLK